MPEHPDVTTTPESAEAACVDSELLSGYDYDLPPERIAHVPAARRDESRLLTLARGSGRIGHRQMADFPALLDAGDLLVLNETRVIPARLTGVRTKTGGKWGGLYLGFATDGLWRVMGQTRGRLQPGECITIVAPGRHTAPGDTLELTLVEQRAGGEWLATPNTSADVWSVLDEFGAVPLPPYIDRDEPRAEDADRYQTVYARTPGAIAAPTAGLHFTEELLQQCRDRGARVTSVTLHVGVGTFRPISAERLSDHRMHREWCELPETAVVEIETARQRGGRVVAVGTTTVRTLESVAASGPLRPWSGETDLYIRPPYEFRVVDALLTNFHLPRSTLLVLVSAFAGRQHVLHAYEAAIRNHYRFYSYGDAMFLA